MDDKCISDNNLIRIVELEKRFVLMQETGSNALKLAANDLKTRLDAMNEFQHQLDRQAATFITRNELDLIMQRINENKKADISIWLSLIAILVSFVFGVIKFYK